MDTKLFPCFQLVEQSIHDFRIPDGPDSLYGPIRYFLGLPGKRIRPVFVLMALELFRDAELQDAQAALATELFHNFSLVHDDIMDKADLRRGFQTVHKKWNEETALLAGDALLILAYEALIKSRTLHLPKLVARFNHMSMAVCEGQQLDMDYSRTDRVSMNEYQSMIDRKTGALIAFCFEMGGFLGGANELEIKELYSFGAAMGRCFQLRDDYLDLFGDPSKTGKVRGGDIANRKLTHPILTSLYLADNKDFIEIWNKTHIAEKDQIEQALSWMELHRIPQMLEAKIEEEMNFGLRKLLSLRGNEEARNQIEQLCKSLAYREK